MTAPAAPAAPAGADVATGDSTRALIVVALGILVLYLILRAKPAEAVKTAEAAKPAEKE